jgi:hypothetical protein
VPGAVGEVFVTEDDAGLFRNSGDGCELAGCCNDGLEVVLVGAEFGECQAGVRSVRVGGLVILCDGVDGVA